MRRFLDAYLLCLLILPASAAAQTESAGTQADPLKSDILAYLALGDAKAFAVASHESRAAAWGYAHSQPDIETAVGAALATCREQAVLHQLTAECRVIAIGNALLSAPHGNASPASDSSSPDPITYESRWENGREFTVGSSRDLQVWISLSARGEADALVYLVNASDQPVTFAPQEIAVSITKESRHGTVREAKKAFSAEEWEKKVRTRQAIAAGLYAAGASLSNQPQPQTSTFGGSYNAYQPQYGYGTLSGQITTWPSAADYAAAQAQTNAQVQAMASQLRSSFETMAATLMRTHTLAPQSYYGGTVHFQKLRGARRVLAEVPFGGRVFSFELAIRK